MARPHRIQIPGALYHILVRGNQRQDVFVDDWDRREYLKRVERYKKELSFILYAYVLMNNHVHLLMETPKTTLSKIMQRINLTYTQYFNRKYGKVGHLFQGRYKSFLCDRDAYLLSLVRYIHLNPVRAKLVRGPGLADPGEVLRYFSARVSLARRRYGDFVREAIGEGKDDSLYSAVGQQILGDDRFVEEVEKRIDKLDKPLSRPPFEEILKAVEKVTGISEDEILSRGRKKEILKARGVLVGIWRGFGYRLVDLQSRLRRDLSVLSRLSRTSEQADGEKTRRRVFEILNARMQA